MRADLSLFLALEIILLGVWHSKVSDRGGVLCHLSGFLWMLHRGGLSLRLPLARLLAYNHW